MSALAEDRIAAARRLCDADRLAEAETLCREILQAEPDHADAWNLLGLAVFRQGRERAGTAALQRALHLDGGRADIHMNLGNALREAGDAAAAADCLRAALALEPAYAAAHFNLGLALEAQGDAEAALKSVLRALELDATLVAAYLKAGALFAAAGRRREAKEIYEAAIRVDARCAPAYRGMAELLESAGRLNDAIAWCQHALKLDTEDPQTLYLLGLLLEQHGSIEHAAAAVKQALKRADPGDAPDMLFTLALMLPPVTRSRAHIGALRARFLQNLDALEAQPLRLAGRAVAPPFFLSYHGECDREPHEKLARVLLAACPGLDWSAPHCARWRGPGGRIRVGFLSRYLRDHSIGKTTRGLVAQLDRTRFEVIALYLPPVVRDETAQFIRRHAERSLDLPLSVTAAREAIAALELDVLFYQDIGMEPMSYFLAFSRLAPVQCLSFGHPDTTGIPAMDWFVSSDLYEPEGAEAHYSERLFRLRDAGTLAYYYRPALQQPAKTRVQLGLPAEGTVYLCPQTLFKVHPDMDALVAGILAGDPAARVVFLEGKYPSWADLLRERLHAAVPGAAGRIAFLPQMGAADFVNLLALADVVLDTPHFNGMNTSLEAFAMGAPIVTLPGAYQRGRHTAGMYRRMGIDEAVASDAADYVRIALRLGTDRAARRALSQRILERCGVLYEDANVVREFERFFAYAVEDARKRAPAATSAAAPVARPSDAQELVEQGEALLAQDRDAEAEACFREAAVLRPELAAAQAGLGGALQMLGRYEEAVQACRSALALEPDGARAHATLAACCRAQGRLEEALALGQRAVALDPGRAGVHNDLAVTLLELRRPDQAEASIGRALALAPESADAHWNLAMALLLKGDYARGWREYEWRWVQDPAMRREAGRFRVPRWRGESDPGKTLLLHPEQGLGDALQFIRYAPLAAARGLRVLCQTHPALERLLATADGVERVIRPGETAHIDYHCPLLSLPGVFGTTLETVPAPIPYLHPDPALVAQWAARLPPAAEGLRVGLAWASNAHLQADRPLVARSKTNRSVPEALLGVLQGVPGVRFVSLQKDRAPGVGLPLAAFDPMAGVTDFADTAALVAGLDLVISVDTSVAHVAGALGKPLWLLLPHDGEWRWLLERADSPWYPGARIFRQPRAGAWAPLLDEVAQALLKFSASFSTRSAA